jgi:RNA polymerase primary sigma factor
MNNDAMQYYMRDIREYPLITTDEEARLAALIQGGDHEAKMRLVRANLRLVVKVAHDFRGMGLPLQDLISEGNVGLIRAAEKFDPAKGAKFSSYAVWWIKQSMRRALFEKSKMIRVPIASAGKIRKIRNARGEMVEELGREPTDAELARRLAFSEKVVQRLRSVDLRTVSLDDPILEGEKGELRNLIPDDRAEAPDSLIGDAEAIQRMNRLFETLDPRERRVLGLRFGLDGSAPQTLEEVSRQIGRTRERIRQIQKRALLKLRRRILSEPARSKASAVVACLVSHEEE